MYSVYLSNKGQEPLLIFDDRLPTPETALISPSLDIESGRAGSFDTTLPPTNQGYSAIEAMKTELIVKKNNKEVWRGRVLNPSTDFYNQMRIEVEGELTYLTDTFQPQHEYKTETLRQVIEGILSIHNQKVSGANEPFDKTFYVGAVFVSDEADDPTGTDKSYRTTDYDTTLNCLKKIGDAYKGYFIVKHGEDGKRYLDFVKEFDITSSQRIDFGENLLDFTKSFKMEDLCTVAMPIGGRISSDVGDDVYIYHSENDNPVNFLDRDGNLGYDPNANDREAGVVYLNELGLTTNDKIYVSCTQYGDAIGYQGHYKDGLWSFATENGAVIANSNKSYSASSGVETYEKYALTIPAGAHRLRIASTTFENPRLQVYKQRAESQLDEHFTISTYEEVDNNEFKHTTGDIYLIYKPLYEKYGWHEKKLEFSNLEKAEDLWNMATYWLTHTQFEQMVLDVTAFDLSAMNVSYGNIWINMNVPIYSKPHGLTNNLLLPCTKMSIKLGSPEDTQYTLGYTTPAAISDTQSNVNADLSKLMNEVPTYSDTFKAIQDNSTAIINAMYGSGYVSFLHNIPGNPNPISDIVITDVEDPSLATWKWVWNGGGLAYQKWDSTYQRWISKTAMTKDGTIMGDMIAAHTLLADQMWGGTLTLGYLSYTDSQQVVHHTEGNLVVKDSNNNTLLSVERQWGLTANGTDAFARIDNGVICGASYAATESNGGFKLYPQTSKEQLVNGVINFNNFFDGVAGLDIRTKAFGINSNSIYVSDGFDGVPHAGYNNTITLDNHELRFIKGILVSVNTINNGGE